MHLAHALKPEQRLLAATVVMLLPGWDERPAPRRPAGTRREPIRWPGDNRRVPDLPPANELWKYALAAVPLGALLVAMTNAWLAARNERRRSQPVVIAHDE